MLGLKGVHEPPDARLVAAVCQKRVNVVFIADDIGNGAGNCDDTVSFFHFQEVVQAFGQRDGPEEIDGQDPGGL